jgi:hypothetical protein
MDERSTRYRAVYLKQKYGMTPGEYEALLDLQRGLCAICECELRHPYIDHSHATGAIRGLLCASCNPLIGKYSDDPEALRRQAESDEPIYERRRIERELRTRHQRRWSYQYLVTDSRVAPGLLVEVLEGFQTAHTKHRGCCAHCQRLVILPSIKMLESEGWNGWKGPVLRVDHELGETHIFCSGCTSRTRAEPPPTPTLDFFFFGVSSVPPDILRRAANYLERPPVHQGRRAL